MEEEKVKKIKEQFRKTYLDTIKHQEDIEKWIRSGRRKKGDIRRSIQRLEAKYNKLCELNKKLAIQHLGDNKLQESSDIEKNRRPYDLVSELESKRIEFELIPKNNPSLDQIKNKIENLYQLSGIKSNNSKIDLVSDIQGNEEGLYYIEMKRRFPIKIKGHNKLRIGDRIHDKLYNFKHKIRDKFYDIKYKLEERKNNKKNNKNKKVGRISAFLMAGALVFSGGITVGEPNVKNNNEKSEQPTNTYVDINKNKNEFKDSLYVQALNKENKSNEKIQKSSTSKIDIKETNKNETNKEIESSDDVFFVRANTEYTESSDGSGNVGNFTKDRKVKIYNRALVKTDKYGNKSILNVSNVGQTWKEYAEENNINYTEFKEYMDSNPNIEKMVSLVSENGKEDFGWVSIDKLERVEDLER